MVIRMAINLLTPFQKSLIVGTMLGDGAMRRKRGALLEVNHSIHQREYVDWKYRALENLVRTPPSPRRGNGCRLAYRFTTLSLAELAPIYDAFYRGRKKVVPALDLDQIALAVWFMDDGSRSRSSVYFNTQQFSNDDQHRLMRMLKDQWGINCTLNKDKVYSRIRVAVKSMHRLRAAIRSFVLPSLAYKLPD